MAMQKKEVWLTENARESLNEIESALPVKAQPSQIVEAALRDMASRIRRR